MRTARGALVSTWGERLDLHGENDSSGSNLSCLFTYVAYHVNKPLLGFGARLDDDEVDRSETSS